MSLFLEFWGANLSCGRENEKRGAEMGEAEKAVFLALWLSFGYRVCRRRLLSRALSPTHIASARVSPVSRCLAVQRCSKHMFCQKTIQRILVERNGKSRDIHFPLCIEDQNQMTREVKNTGRRWIYNIPNRNTPIHKTCTSYSHSLDFRRPDDSTQRLLVRRRAVTHNALQIRRHIRKPPNRKYARREQLRGERGIEFLTRIVHLPYEPPQVLRRAAERGRFVREGLPGGLHGVQCIEPLA